MINNYNATNSNSHNIEKKIIENLEQMEKLILNLDQSKR